MIHLNTFNPLKILVFGQLDFPRCDCMGIFHFARPDLRRRISLLRYIPQYIFLRKLDYVLIKISSDLTKLNEKHIERIPLISY